MGQAVASIKSSPSPLKAASRACGLRVAWSAPAGNFLPRLSPAQILQPERCRTDAFPGSVENRVRHRRWNRRAGRLAQTTPFRATRECKVSLDRRHLVDTHQVVVVKISVDESAIF